MEIQYISPRSTHVSAHPRNTPDAFNGLSSFEGMLASRTMSSPQKAPHHAPIQTAEVHSPRTTEPSPSSSSAPSPTGVAATYQRQKEQALPGQAQAATPPAQDNGWAIYKDDQLLSNPGGDHYDLDQKKMISEEPTSFFGRLGKNIADAAGNIKNFFKNIFFGAKTHYRDEQNQIQETQRKGIIGSLVEFVKDLGSALSFGAWRPDGEPEPQGVQERVMFTAGKVKEAIAGDLLGGVGGTLNQMGEDLLLAGWNLVEIIPDATIGNFPAGRKLTTTIFDNGQVAIDYLTDVMPLGEAWLRVHAPNLQEGEMPIIYNMKLPERFPEDERWSHIRNTPFRKKIETVGSLLADLLTLKITGQINTSSERRR